MKHMKRYVSVLLTLAIMLSCTLITIGSVSAAEGSRAYFDNSKYNWAQVYVYAYGTKENAKWPGQLMEKGADGLYSIDFPATYKSENVIFNNGLEEDAGKEQFPKNSGLSLKTGECKLLTADSQWVNYGKMDDHAYGFSYTPSGTAFSKDYIEVKLGLKGSKTGSYSIDGSAKKTYANGDTIKIGEGKIGNSTIKLTLTTKGSDAVETTQEYTFKKKFTSTKTTFSAKSDGHTTDAEGGYYGTNPNMQLGKYKKVTVDGKTDDWDSSMIIAQGVANDDPRVYMPSSMHEQPWDAYALYGAWDDDNLYFMWEMANTTYIVSPSDNFAASNEARPWRNSIPMYLALSIDPNKQATGKAVGTKKDGSTYTNPFVWGCDGGVAKDGGTSFTTHIDTLVAMDSNNSNGGASIFKADTKDTDGTYMFNYDTRVPIGVNSFQAQDNRNGFKIKYANGTKSDSIIGVNGAKGDRKLGDNLDPNSNWVDFKDLGYKSEYGYIYEVAIPLKTLGIDRNYIETKGIGAMQILTYGTSGMDTLPHDPSMLDSANVEYSYDPSTSHEKEDIDNITVPLARMGALLSDTVVNEAPLEINCGADKNSGQSAGTAITLQSEAYNNKGNVSYEFYVNNEKLTNATTNTAKWTPSKDGSYSLKFVAKDSNGKTVEKTMVYTVGEASSEKLLGDANGDGKVDVKDATLIQKYVVLMADIAPENLTVADYNKDGRIDVKDASAIQRSVLNK